jgi:hypothetical protein
MKENKLLKKYNLAQIILWITVFILTITTSITDLYKYKLIIVLRVVETIQLFDIPLNMFGITKGNTLMSILQVIERNAIAWIFIDTDTNNNILLNTLIPWALSDSIRYIYHINHNTIAGHLR